MPNVRQLPFSESRQGRNTKAMMTAAKPSRNVVAPDGPNNGNSCLAIVAPPLMQVIATSTAPKAMNFSVVSEGRDLSFSIASF